MTPTMHNHVKARVMWIPLVLVGSILYWTVALGLGGMSLSLLGGPAQEDLALQPKAVATPDPAGQVTDEDRESAILVHLPSAAELRAAGGSPAQDDGTGRLSGTAEPQPPPEDSVGRTSY
jgi:hypothetical protein